jgi:NADPH2:quinone reductase
VKGELNIGALMAKRGGVLSAGLRARPVTGKGSKADIVSDVKARLWPLVESGAVKPIIGRTLPLAQAAEAHRALEASDVFGKVVLTA